MRDKERRQPSDRRADRLAEAALRAGLTTPQLRALETLEQFQWTLKFVRRPLFQDPIPVVSDREGKRYAVLEADGSLNESPDFKIRD